MINNILKTIHQKDGFIHWMTQRISALVLLSSILFLDIFPAFVLFTIAGSIHLFVGVSTLLDDYVHGTLEHLLGTTILKVCIIYALKTLIIILF